MPTPYDVVELPRLLTPDQATAMVGDKVGAAEPTVTRPTVAVDQASRQPVFAYLPLGDVAELRRAVLAVSYNEGVQRANGQRNRSRTFGYRPRRPVYRRDACGPTALQTDHPGSQGYICDFSDRLAEILADIDPRLVAQGEAAVTPVEPDWRLGESKLWTSGVINQSAVLPWHRDAFNFPAWSAMPVLRRGMDGGYLRIPEYGATVPCRDGWAVFFAGYELLHGVTPMRLRRPDGYRYSVVYYALKGMKDCFTAAVETAYGRRRRTEREQDMARRLAAGDPIIPGKGLPKGRTFGGRMIGGKVAFDGRMDFDDHGRSADEADRERT